MHPSRLNPRRTHTWRGRVAQLVSCGVIACASAGWSSRAVAAQGAPAQSDGLLVSVESGALRGAAEQGMRVFRGIPYAAPPVGALRWRPPHAPMSWTGVRDAIAFCSACPQPNIPGLNPGDAPGDEDCLTLNVYGPPTGSGLPVMVWIHGDSLVAGSGRDALYAPTNLVANGVIVVTFNYRLGKLGFFAPAPLIEEARAAGESVGNYGTMDQIAALQWVKRNIAAFGGDPSNVTIFGESAGARSVTWLMVSPPARGLFHKAIAQSARVSPLPGMTSARHGMPAQSEADAVFMASRGATTMEELRALPAERLLVSMAEYAAGEFKGAFIDGAVIPDDPVPLFVRGAQAKIPFLIGCNSWDASLFAYTPAGHSGSATSESGSDFEALYGDVPVPLRTAALLGDRWFMAGVKLMAAACSPGYAYCFDYMTPGLPVAYPGTPHAWDLPYTFGSLSQAQQPAMLRVRPLDATQLIEAIGTDLKHGSFSRYLMPTADPLNPADARVSMEMAASWAAFAKTGNPSVAGQPAWCAYEPSTDSMRLFRANAESVTGYHAKRIAPQRLHLMELFGCAHQPRDP